MIRIIVLPCCLLMTASDAALACTVCDTNTGQQVRSGILDGDFAATLVGVLLPFPILLGCVALIHFGWPSGGRPTAERHDDVP